MGAGYFAGLLSGGVNSYYNWNLTQNGQTAKTASYATSKFTDLAIDWTGAQSRPWFLWLAYNARTALFIFRLLNYIVKETFLKIM